MLNELRITMHHGVEVEDSPWTSVDKNCDELPPRWLTDLDSEHLVNIIRTCRGGMSLAPRIAAILTARGISRRDFVRRVNLLHKDWKPVNHKVPNETSWATIDYILEFF